MPLTLFAIGQKVCQSSKAKGSKLAKVSLADGGEQEFLPISRQIAIITYEYRLYKPIFSVVGLVYNTEKSRQNAVLYCYIILIMEDLYERKNFRSPNRVMYTIF